MEQRIAPRTMQPAIMCASPRNVTVQLAAAGPMTENYTVESKAIQ